ncbi:helix-turn-helix transcriptional regulator [Nocardiopsis sp. FIRDI 009]|uniref:helix-turn-helix domain-containing protein n=1 Tax=Nocardiopsis sp. FIRDI 009 TaxID=714197 RepID=UPI000E25B894|nr:helix-turn-helix transcriptional regulator [Nocardiopsis sp. FIRDI 009]
MAKVSTDIRERWGGVLQQRREALGMTQEKLGRALGVKGTAVSNLERGRTSPSAEVLTTLDKVLGTDDELATLWDDLVKEGKIPWLGQMEELEKKAASILDCHPFLVPSLLQTTAYATAVMRAVTPWEPRATTDSRVHDRIARGKRFQKAETPVMMVVIGRAVLLDPIDDGPIMCEQLEHIHSLASSERITLQITNEPLHPGLVGPFSVLDPAPEREIVYVESAYKGQFIDDPTAVGEFKMRFHRLQAAAMPPSQSLRLIEKTIEGFRHE